MTTGLQIVSKQLYSDQHENNDSMRDRFSCKAALKRRNVIV